MAVCVFVGSSVNQRDFYFCVKDPRGRGGEGQAGGGVHGPPFHVCWKGAGRDALAVSISCCCPQTSAVDECLPPLCLGLLRAVSQSARLRSSRLQRHISVRPSPCPPCFLCSGALLELAIPHGMVACVEQFLALAVRVSAAGLMTAGVRMLVSCANCADVSPALRTLTECVGNTSAQATWRMSGRGEGAGERVGAWATGADVVACVRTCARACDSGGARCRTVWSHPYQLEAAGRGHRVICVGHMAAGLAAPY